MSHQFNVNDYEIIRILLVVCMLLPIFHSPVSRLRDADGSMPPSQRRSE